MRLRRHRADILGMTTYEAWENYCNALHLSRTAHYRGDRWDWMLIARQSLDVYFARLEKRRECLEAIGGLGQL
jgi:hypothetical protein